MARDILSDLKKRFAETHGLSERTARRHFNKNSPEWRAFRERERRAPNTESLTPCTVEQVAAFRQTGPAEPPRAGDSEAELILSKQWAIWNQAGSAWERACVEGDDIRAHNFGQATIKALEAFYKAKSQFEQQETDNRQKIPLHEFHLFRVRALLPIANMIRNLAAQLGPVMNPQNAAFAIRAGEEYMIATVHPQIQKCIAALDEFAPAATEA